MNDEEFLLTVRTNLHKFGVPSDSLPDSTVRALAMFSVEIKEAYPRDVPHGYEFRARLILKTDGDETWGATPDQASEKLWQRILDFIHPELPYTGA